MRRFMTAVARRIGWWATGTVDYLLMFVAWFTYAWPYVFVGLVIIVDVAVACRLSGAFD